MQRLERLMAITDALRRAAPRPLSARRLAADFGVSERTIERDLASLRSAGIPIYAEFGRNGGTVTLDRLGNVFVALSPAEVTALITAVDAAGESMPFADAAATAVERILDVLPPETRVATEHLRDRTRTIDDDANPAGRRVRRSIEESVRRQVVVNIEFEDLEGVVTQRSVDPVGFLRQRDGWYLIGWCHLREAGRMFHLGRIRRANLTRRPAGDHDLDDTLGWVPESVSRP